MGSYQRNLLHPYLSQSGLMEHDLNLGDCVRMRAAYIADYCLRTGLDEFGYVIKMALVKGTVMGIHESGEIFVEWDDGDVGFHNAVDLETCLDTNLH